MTSNITIRFNNGRMVSAFDDKEGLDRWIKFYGDDFAEPYMYTIHGHGDVKCFEKYKKSLNVF